MPRISYTQLNALPDVLSSDSFELLLGSIPGSGSSEDLTLKCQQATIGGFSNEAFEVALHGHVLRYRGRVTFPRSLSITFTEHSDFSTYTKLRLWHELIAGSDSNTSAGYRNEYAINAALNIYDTTGRIAATNYFEKLFLQELSDIQLDGTSSQGITVQATFSYDRHTIDGMRMR